VWPRTSTCFLIMVSLRLKKSHIFTEAKQRISPFAVQKDQKLNFQGGLSLGVTVL